MLLSLSGVLCLYLAELLSLPACIVLVLVHVIIGKWFYTSTVFPKALFPILIVAVSSLEVGRIIFQGREGIVPALRDMIVILALTRLIMPKSGREIAQLVGITFSQCILATIFTTSPLFLIGLLLQAFFIPIVLDQLDERSFMGPGETTRSRPGRWIMVWSSIIVMSCILFYLIPRPSSALMRGALVHRSTIGFSEEMNLARSTQLEEDSRIVMRLVWNSGKIPEVVYLAGARLEELTADGFVKHGETLATESVNVSQDRLSTDHLTIYPTGIETKNVFFPYYLVSVSPGATISQGSNVYWMKDPPPMYDIWVTRNSSDQGTLITSVPDELLEVAGLGATIAGQGTTREKASRIAEYLKKHHEYTLDGLTMPVEVSPISWFVFNGKKGSCEHFASALATMLRGCGIPTRVVTGFLVNEFNPSGNYFIIRARTAHAWVEFWDKKWFLLDATPFALSGAVRRVSLIDSLRFTWIRWVIHYSLEDQITIAGYLARSPWSVRERLELVPSAALAGILLIPVVVFASKMWRRKRLGPYAKVLQALEKKGVRLDISQSHEIHVQELLRRNPSLGSLFRNYLQTYLPWRFGNQDVDIFSITENLIERIRESSDT